MKYAWWPGCVSRGACPELYQSMLAVAQRLDLELIELKEAACTGAGVLHEREPELADTLNARTFAMADKLGLPLLNNCSTCQGVMSKAQDNLAGDAYREHVNAKLRPEGLQYSGQTLVKNLLWYLVEDFGLVRLRQQVARPLKSLRVAPFYGCYIVRPTRILGFDQYPDRDKYLEQVISAVGAEPVDFFGKTKCCGFPILTLDRNTSLSMAGDHLLEAKDKGADCMVTPCPLCHLNLDSNQPDAAKVKQRPIGLPVIHLPQMLALAFGIDTQVVGLNRHVVTTAPLLAKAGVQ